MDEDAEPQSLVVVVSYDNEDGYHIDGPYFCSILQLEALGDHHENENQAIETEFSVNFLRPQPQPQTQPPLPLPFWLISPLAGSTEDLYLQPDWHYDPKKHVSLNGSLYDRRSKKKLAPMHGWIYNLRTKNCKRIEAPLASKGGGHVVTMGGHIYLMAYPRTVYLSAPVFERYNPPSDSWEERQHLPCFPWSCGAVLATAVFDDTILFLVNGIFFWAYYVPKNKWYDLKFDDQRIYCIRGEAFVLGNTIYALETDCFDSVLALKFLKTENNGDLVLQIVLVSTILVSGMEEIEVESKGVQWSPGLMRLAFLGENNFCIVRCCLNFCLKEYQSIQVINIKLEGERNMTVMNRRFYKLKIEGKKQFRVCRLFSLPKCTTTVPGGKPHVVKFDLDYAALEETNEQGIKETDEQGIKETDEEGIKPVQKEKAAEGRSIAMPVYTSFPAHMQARTPFYTPRPLPRHPSNQPYMPPSPPLIPLDIQARIPFYIFRPLPPPPLPSNHSYMRPIPPPLLSYHQTAPTPHPNTNPCPSSGYQDSCQLCGFFGHTAIGCPSYPLFHHLPCPPKPTPTT